MSTRSRTVWTFAVTSAALFMASLDNLVVTTALPSIRDHLHASLQGLQWTVNAYTLTFAVLLLTGATLGERYGRRRRQREQEVQRAARKLQLKSRRWNSTSPAPRRAPVYAAPYRVTQASVAGDTGSP